MSAQSRDDPESRRHLPWPPVPFPLSWLSLDLSYTLAPDGQVARAYELSTPRLQGRFYDLPSYDFNPGAPDSLIRLFDTPAPLRRSLERHLADLAGQAESLIARYLGELAAGGGAWPQSWQANLNVKFLASNQMSPSFPPVFLAQQESDFNLQFTTPANSYSWRVFELGGPGGFKYQNINDLAEPQFGVNAALTLSHRGLLEVHERYRPLVEEFLRDAKTALDTQVEIWRTQAETAI